MQLSDKPSTVTIISIFTLSVYASVKYNYRKSFNYLIIEKLKLSNSTLNLNCFVNLILIKNGKTFSFSVQFCKSLSTYWPNVKKFASNPKLLNVKIDLNGKCLQCKNH